MAGGEKPAPEDAFRRLELRHDHSIHKLGLEAEKPNSLLKWLSQGRPAISRPRLAGMAAPGRPDQGVDPGRASPHCARTAKSMSPTIDKNEG